MKRGMDHQYQNMLSALAFGSVVGVLVFIACKTLGL